MRTSQKTGANTVALDIPVISQKDHGAQERYAQYIIYNGIKKKL